MISIKVPPLGESIVEATISRWLKKEGDAVAPGETLVELETDKITVEVPALQGGTLVKRLHGEGDVVKVDDVLAEVDETAVPAAASANLPSASAPAASAPAPTAAPVGPGTAPQLSSVSPQHDGVRASPAAQRIAAERQVNLGAVAGTGRGGVVSKPDVVEHLARGAQAPAHAPAQAPQQTTQPVAPKAAPAPEAPTQFFAPRASGNGAAGPRESREKMTTRRKRIAENLLNAKQATAMLTTFNEVDMTAINQFRERHRERIEKETGVRLSAMPFFVKAACQALATYPVVNARLDGDTVVYHHYVNMGIAVASEAGLVVPNIKDAQNMSLLDIARAINVIAKTARDGKLTMEDLTGGTFTITNGGVFGSLLSTPIVNYPQVGILGLHKVQDRPVAIDGQVVIRPMMYVALSYDHRLIDGEQAVKFLVRVKELLEEPATMLI